MSSKAIRFSLLGIAVAALAFVGYQIIAPNHSTDKTAFAEMMIPHHEQAIEISEIAKQNSTNPDVLELANTIIAAQDTEITVMQNWLEGTDPNSHSMDDHAGHMSGMLSESEISALSIATGREFDKLFLDAMIKHHLGALEMATPLVTANDVELSELAKQIVEEQTNEIAKMEMLLLNLI
jgi:uncharacterized protein (DUF305 family)